MGPRNTRVSDRSLLSSGWFCFCGLLFTARSVALPVHGGHRARACVSSVQFLRRHRTVTVCPFSKGFPDISHCERNQSRWNHAPNYCIPYSKNIYGCR